METVLKVMDRAIHRILSITAIASIILMLLLACFIGTQVFARNIFGVNIKGLFDLSSYSLIIFTFLSAAYALEKKRHISVEILVSHLSEKARPSFDICVYLIALVFPIILGYTAWQWASNSFKSGVLTISEIPIQKGILISAIVIGSILLVLQIIRIIADSIASLHRHAVLDQHIEYPLRDNPLIWAALLIASIIVGLILAIHVNIILGLCLLSLVMLFSGMPVFLALGFIGSFGLYFLVGTSALKQIPFFAFQAVDRFPLTCLPLFIIAGMIMEKGKIVDRLFLLFQIFSGTFYSAPLVATILVGGFFCAISGSSVATTSIIATVSLPLLVRQGYSKSISSGVVAGSTIGTVIPPSIGYILYGVITNESIGQLFVAGVIPGAIIFGSYCLYVIILGAISKHSLFEEKKVPVKLSSNHTSWKEKALSFRSALWGIFAPVFVLGGIYLGIFTPSEAAAIMVIYAIVITMFVMRTLTCGDLVRCVLVGAEITSMILLIIVGARIFGAVISQLQIAANLVLFVNKVGLSPIATLGLVSLTLFILGMFLDSASILVIMLPVFYPLVMAAGFNSVWFGVFFIVMLEIGLLTPPVGLNLFVIYGISGFPLPKVIKGSLPFVFIMLFCLLLFVVFPQLVTWLPATMLK